jgi:hypothetical protein
MIRTLHPRRTAAETFCIVVAVVAAISFTASPAPAAATMACPARWQVIASPDPGDLGNGLADVVALSRSDAWAAGSQTSVIDGQLVTTPLVEHWDGSVWSVISTPGGFTGGLGRLLASTPSDIWSVGEKTRPEYATPLIEHFDGSAWKVVPSPQVVLGYLFDVAGTSPKDIWAVGITRPSAFATLIEHFDGSSWSVVPSPDPVRDAEYLDLASVVALAPDDVWAVGGYHDESGVSRTFAEHWDGAAWSLVRTPNRGPGDNTLHGLTSVGGNLWAVGSSTDRRGLYRTLSMRYDGASWSIVDTANAGAGGDELDAVAGDAAGGLWAVGGATDGADARRTLTERADGGGSWDRVRSLTVGIDDTLYGVAVGLDGEVWAVGASHAAGITNTLIERICPPG